MTPPTTLDTVIKRSSLIVESPTPPVIVVGLPRSGSSYLAHVLSCLDNWFIFDDLYAYQKASILGIDSDFDFAQDPARLQKYVNQLSWQLWAKIKYEENFQVPDLSLEAPFEMERALLTALEEKLKEDQLKDRSDTAALTWPSVLEEWMTRLTLHGKKQRWGYKTPQDFMHMDELARIFPGVKFIYILRDPRKMMRSFKNLPRLKTSGNEDGESRQYHPAVYALYWKSAYEKVQAFIQKGKAPVEVVKFEDLVNDPEAVADRLARFLETTVAGDVFAQRSNSSVRHGSPVELTNTEVVLCEKIAGNYMEAAGYDLTAPRPKLWDAFDLIRTSAVFTRYQIERIATNKKARTSVMAFVKSLFKR
ncbi:MAG: sulfotransferase [Cyanobacteria bacterium J06621_11]